MFTSQDLDNYVEELQKLVNIDSPTGHKTGIEKVISFFAKRAEAMGLKIITKELHKESGPCLIITNAEDNEDIDVLLLAHMDTVFEVGTAHNRPFSVKNNKAYGPGVIDDKGGALMGMYALKHIERDKLKFAYFLNSNEEQGSINNSVLIQELAKKAQYTLVLEAAREDGSLVDKRYGNVNYQIKFKGKPSKSSNPLDGNSVLLEMGNFIRSLNILNNHFRGTLLNFTIQESKPYKYSQVQDEITLGLQMRFLSNEAVGQLNDKIKQCKSNKTLKDIKIEEEIVSYHPCMSLTDLGKSFRREIWSCGRKSGVSISYQASFGGSDGCFAAEAGSTVFDGLGPIGGNFHREDEYLDLSSVESRCNLLINILNKIAEKNNEVNKK